MSAVMSSVLSSVAFEGGHDARHVCIEGGLLALKFNIISLVFVEFHHISPNAL